MRKISKINYKSGSFDLNHPKTCDELIDLFAKKGPDFDENIIIEAKDPKEYGDYYPIYVNIDGKNIRLGKLSYDGLNTNFDLITNAIPGFGTELSERFEPENGYVPPEYYVIKKILKLHFLKNKNGLVFRDIRNNYMNFQIWEEILETLKEYDKLIKDYKIKRKGEYIDIEINTKQSLLKKLLNR